MHSTSVCLPIGVARCTEIATSLALIYMTGDWFSPAAASVLVNRAPTWGRMYRVTNDFHDDAKNFETVMRQHLETASVLAPFIGLGDSYPDLDMLPFGSQAWPPGPNQYSDDEQRFVMTLWAITRSPLILGAQLPLAANDTLTLALMSNVAVLDVNANSCRNFPTPVVPSSWASQNTSQLFAWTAAPGPDGNGAFVALFNLRNTVASVSAVSGVPHGCVVNLWTGASEGQIDGTGTITKSLESHAAGLWSVRPCI
jgi:alpha-galactosidase